MSATRTLSEAIDDVSESAIAATVRNTNPLADFEEFATAQAAANAVLSDARETCPRCESDVPQLVSTAIGGRVCPDCADDLPSGEELGLRDTMPEGNR